jgi:hypothetical protein
MDVKPTPVRPQIRKNDATSVTKKDVSPIEPQKKTIVIKKNKIEQEEDSKPVKPRTIKINKQV